MNAWDAGARAFPAGTQLDVLYRLALYPGVEMHVCRATLPDSKPQLVLHNYILGEERYAGTPCFLPAGDDLVSLGRALARIGKRGDRQGPLT